MREAVVAEELARSPSHEWAGASGSVRHGGLQAAAEVGQPQAARTGTAGQSQPTSGSGVNVGGIKRHKRGLLVTLAVFTLLTAGGGLWAYRWFGQDRPLNRASAPVPKVIPFTSFPGTEMEPSFSPDGKQIAFTWDGPGGDNYDIYVKPLDAGAPLRLTNHPGEDRSPCWSPDGRHIALVRFAEHDNMIVLVPAPGGPGRILHSVRAPGAISLGHFLSWSPDGKSLAFSERVSPQAPFGIHLLSVERLERRSLTSPPAGTRGDRFPAISPGGDTLAFTRRSNNDTDDIYLAPVSGGEPRRLTSDNSVINGLAWTPDGREIVYSSNHAGARYLWKVPATGGPPERIPAGGEDPAIPAVARQGGLLAYTSTRSDVNIWRTEARGSKGAGASPPAKLISSTRSDESPQYSPDGKKVVFSSSRTGHLELWTCDADGSNPVQLTSFDGPHVGSPRWSPDGRQIAFDSTAEGHRDIYLVGVDGGRPRRLTTEPSADVRPSWSRDGRSVYFGSDRGGGWQVWKAPAEGGPAVRLTKGGGREAFESTDGRFIYYAKENVPGLWRMPAEGGDEVKVLDQVRQGAWAVWEQGVYFLNPEARPHLSIEFYSFATERTSRVITFEKEMFWSGPGLTATADGRWILYAQNDQTESDIMLVENFS